MRTGFAGATLLSSFASAFPASSNLTDALAAEGITKLWKWQAQQHPAPSCNSTCNSTNVYVRKEWDSLNSRQKKAYVDAVLCLQALPAQSGSFAPGARSRYDDFVALHINQTLSIHATANFLSWHRYFVLAYETALREECGYTGYQPYIDWARYSEDPLNAPLFDGSSTSISNNGANLPDKNTSYYPSAANPLVVVPPGTGGSCVTAGPFVNMSVNLGPGLFGAQYSDVPSNPDPSGFGHNPRCLRRDISKAYAGLGLKDTDVASLITRHMDIASFQNDMQGGFNFNISALGVHSAGHFLVGGDPGGDFFASPGDPYFFLHHAQIDRTWWTWQNMDLKNRQYAIAGTVTMLNSPPSRNGTLDDVLDLGPVNVGEPIKIRDAMSTMAGKFCYIYQ